MTAPTVQTSSEHLRAAGPGHRVTTQANGTWRCTCNAESDVVTQFWCDLCLRFGPHQKADHPRFIVRGEVKVEVEFTVDLLELIREHPSDWARELDDADGDVEEAANQLIAAQTTEDGWEAPSHASSLIRWDRSWDPELDWNPPRDLDGEFWGPLQDQLKLDRLVPPEPGELLDPAARPDELGMDPIPGL